MGVTQVRFEYQTGIRRRLFRNAYLCGNWDALGQLDPNSWSQVAMEGVTSNEGCPTFVATVNLQAGDAGSVFEWGVRLDGPGGEGLWGIMTEVNHPGSTQRVLQFHLDFGVTPSVQVYRLNVSRYLGANKLFQDGNGAAGIQFRVWAPNATAVDTVIGYTWQEADPQRTPLEGMPPGRRSIPPNEICGGYIAADDVGIHPHIGPFAMVRQSDAVWATNPDDPRLARFEDMDHIPYMFKVTKDDGKPVFRTDLFSRCQIGAGALDPGNERWYGRLMNLDGGKGCSAVIDPDKIAAEFDEGIYPETSWIDEAAFWAGELNPAKPLPQLIDDLVIYELHLGALGIDGGRQGTIKDACEMLDYLEELGVNAIELLPLAEFGGPGWNWGYATSHYFAVEYGGGGRDKFKHFIRECHRRGIAVIMDVVYNHFVHDGERAQWMYDTNDHAKNPFYWYEGYPEDYAQFNADVTPGRRGTGGYVDNVSTGWAPRYHEAFIRKMFAGMALTLIEEFHVDGFRVDQTTSMHAYNKLHSDGRPMGNVNIFGAKTLREWSRTQRFVLPDVFLMAEDHSGWDAVTSSTEEGGLGFDATWYADFYHHLVGDGDGHAEYAKLLKNAGYGDNRPLAMDRFAGALAASGQGKVVYAESHDEAGNGSGTARNILIAINHAPLIGETRRYAEARCRFAFGVTVFSAGVPLFLFGEEVGTAKPFLYDKVLEHKEDLSGMRSGLGERLYTFYRDAIYLRRAHPGLRSRNIDVVHVHNDNRLIAFRRWDDNQEFLVVASLSNTPFNIGYSIRNERIREGAWREIFNSDAGIFGGDNLGNAGSTIHASRGELSLVVPCNGVVVLRRES